MAGYVCKLLKVVIGALQLFSPLVNDDKARTDALLYDIAWSQRATEANDAADPGWPSRISYLIGPDRKIVRAYETVKPADHPAQVLADVP